VAAAPNLGDARRLFRARRFPEVIRLLEPEVFRFRESADYFLMLGTACLHTGDLGGATSYLGRARQLKPGSVTALLGLAAVHFKRAETDQALKLWLETLDEDPRNPVALRGMNLLRRGMSRDELQAYVDAGKLPQLYPRLPGRPIWPLLLAIALGGAALLAGGSLAVRHFRPPAASRPGVSGIYLPSDGGLRVDPDAAAVYILSEREIEQAFKRAKSLLLDYRDNPACVEINRILLSNASAPVKERALALKSFLRPPNFATFRDPYTYREVSSQPRLYDGCHVAWKGKVANLSLGQDAITFDLLVGYEGERELEGTVPVRLDFAADLADGAGLEVLGRIVVDGSRIMLAGVSLHRLVP
jgi:tetratricopeptide (TPR) repeat protein